MRSSLLRKAYCWFCWNLTSNGKYFIHVHNEYFCRTSKQGIVYSKEMETRLEERLSVSDSVGILIAKPKKDFDFLINARIKVFDYDDFTMYTLNTYKIIKSSINKSIFINYCYLSFFMLTFFWNHRMVFIVII